jgi:hypothetical protein
MSYRPLHRSLGSLGTTDEELASDANIPVRVLQAIRSIESGGNVAAIRFEPHLFLRRVPGAQIPYTRGPTMAASRVGSETNRAAFDRARAINEDAAIRSTSWGLYQVLGSHLLTAYPSDPVGSFFANPREASDRLLISWFRANPQAAAAARALNFTELARRYNGSSLSPWGTRVAAAYARGGGAGGTAAVVRTAAVALTPWLVAGGVGVAALVALGHWGGRSAS